MQNDKANNIQFDSHRRGGGGNNAHFDLHIRAGWGGGANVHLDLSGGGGGRVAGNNAYNVNRLLFQHLPLDLREKRDSSVADLHGQVNPETNSNSTFFKIYFSVSHI